MEKVRMNREKARVGNGQKEGERMKKTEGRIEKDRMGNRG